MRRLFLCLALVAAVVPSAATAVVSSHRVVSRPLTVAVLVPTGGFFAAHNALIANGAQVAADESGDPRGPVGGVKLALVQEPLPIDANPTQVMSSLVQRRIGVVILPCDVDSVPALATAGAKAGLLMLLPCNPDPKVVTSTPMVWPTGMAGNEQVAQLVNYAQSLNGTTAYILTARGSAYITKLDGYFRQAAKLDNVKIVGESTVALNAKDVPAVAAAIKQASPRAIFTAVFSPYAQRIIAGLRAHGVVIPPVYATDGLDADLQLGRYGKALAGVNVNAFGFARPSGQRFLDDYKAAYARLPEGSFPGLGYEAIRILEAAVGHAGSTDPKALDAAFAKGFSVAGVALGDVTYPGNGARLPRTLSGMARIVRGQRFPLFASDASQSTRVPAP